MTERKPEWLTLKGAAEYSGLSARYMRQLVADDLVESVLLQRPNRETAEAGRRGRRLLKTSSLDRFIESGGAIYKNRPTDASK